MSALLWTIAAAIATAIVLDIVVAIAAPEGANKKDQRDREIGRFGEYVGHSFVVIGGVAALGMSLATGGAFSRGEANQGHQRDSSPALRARGDDASGTG